MLTLNQYPLTFFSFWDSAGLPDPSVIAPRHASRFAGEGAAVHGIMFAPGKQYVVGCRDPIGCTRRAAHRGMATTGHRPSVRARTPVDSPVTVRQEAVCTSRLWL